MSGVTDALMPAGHVWHFAPLHMPVQSQKKKQKKHPLLTLPSAEVARPLQLAATVQSA
jgi:hypothetical protein